ncbi:hypothetical protein HDV57DRAFT_114165 [Trichoderma longibrachiatum]|uniref:Uncharacterized protein n=1 Tax=Trichoderma longibrachiatum ATCC 18648 TaxID=983965 RepID=A0A2T4BQI4_TRILO|nr:hypothetical protein M440DRAFT_1142759 [Trichoderma longibrachiatum ATCC 18648]
MPCWRNLGIHNSILKPPPLRSIVRLWPQLCAIASDTTLTDSFQAHFGQRLQRNGLAPLDRRYSARLSSTRGRRTDPGLALALALALASSTSSSELVVPVLFSICLSLSLALSLLVSALLLLTSS